jgi:ketosteroid isomerase-like protein
MAKKKKDKKKAKKAKKSTAPSATKSKAKAGAKKGGKKADKKANKKAGSSKKKNPLRALAQRIVELTTASDEHGIFELYADGVESVEMNMPPTVGLDALRGKLEGWNSMVSNPQFAAANVWVDGNTIVVEWVGNVTLKATGRQTQLREIAVHEVEDGKIVRERYYYDPAVLQP